MYDLTISYVRHPRAPDDRPSEASLFSGTMPTTAYIHCERCDGVPDAADAPAVKAWLMKRWTAKEAALAKAQTGATRERHCDTCTHGGPRIGGTHMAGAQRFSTPVPVMRYAVAFAGWAALLYVISVVAARHPTALFGYAALGCAFYVIATAGGGVDAYELAQHEAASRGLL